MIRLLWNNLINTLAVLDYFRMIPLLWEGLTILQQVRLLWEYAISLQVIRLLSKYTITLQVIILILRICSYFENNQIALRLSSPQLHTFRWDSCPPGFEPTTLSTPGKCSDCTIRDIEACLSLSKPRQTVFDKHTSGLLTFKKKKNLKEVKLTTFFPPGKCS